MKKLGWTFALAATAALSLSACDEAGKPAAATPKSPPIATVNGKPISAEAFDIWVQSQVQKKASELTPEQHKQAVDAIVNLYVTAQAAEKEGIAKNPDTAARLELDRMNILANSLFEQKVKDTQPTEQDLRAEYDRQIASMPKQEYRARHILVPTEEAAKAALAEIQGGAKFEDVARKVSTDGSKDQGGDLGWFAPGQMVKPFADAVQKLAKGEMTAAPVQTDFGWHVIRVEDTRPIEPPAFDQVKDRLGPMAQQRQLREYVENLRKTAKVEIKAEKPLAPAPGEEPAATQLAPSPPQGGGAPSP
jgi:peptidyl-prolyl cis-trans isomerase C